MQEITLLRRLSQQLPSKRAGIRLLLMCVLASHLWAIPGLLNEVPALILRLSVWNLIGVISYYMLFTLCEAVFVWMALNLLGAILPDAIIQQQLLAKGSVLVLVTYLWLAPILHNFRMLLYWPVGAWLWVGLYVLLLLSVQLLFMRFPSLDRRIRAAIDRLVVLAAAYVILDILGIFVIFVRNLM
jgi:hypothetical protein